MEKIVDKTFAIVLTFGAGIKINSYNVQEIGIAKELIKLGYKVDIYSKFFEIDEPTEIYENLTLIPLKGINIWKNITFYPNLIHTLKNKNYDFIQVHGDMNFMTPLILKKCKNKSNKTIMIQGMYKKYSGLKLIIQNIFDFIFKNMIIKNTDFSFGKTKAAKKYLMDKGYKELYNYPIGLDVIKEEDNLELIKRIDDFRSKFSKILLYIGVIDSRRKVEFLVDIIHELKNKNISTGLIIIGKGPNLDIILRKIDNYNLKDQILYLNYVKNNEMHLVYKRSDMLLLPTMYEIWGMTVLEALYFGLPVISTPVAGPATILNEIDFGICLDFNINNWVNQIIFYQNNLNSIDKKEKRKNLILKEYNWKELAKRYFEIIENDI